MDEPYRLALRLARVRYLPLCLGLSALLTGGLGLNGCSDAGRDPFAGVGSPMYQGSGPLPKGGGRYALGNSYEVAGRQYYPQADPSYDKVGQASWYGPKFHRRMTSNGEWFDQDYLSAAHPTLPLPSYVRVTNLENGRNIVVRVNDRGPFVADRIIDMSKKSADALGFRAKGTAKVRVQYLGPAPLDDDGTHLASLNRNLDRGAPAEPVMVGGMPPPAVAATPQPRAVAAMAAGQGAGRIAGHDAGFYVQVGSFSDPSNAGRAEANLASVGPIVITPVDIDRGRFYRVRVGPLDDQATAHAALARVQAAGHHDARVVVAQN
ncbi:MAG TPA: septal ring lytic transglycosylase RlpA family protein [Aestuariivirgaceae bacterium]|nr:septal ring lytic transglycosylase RlpA family protein [Aestuariivirgaceae bacterium]